MTAPVPARDHANMTVAEREFTFDALLAEFGEEENDAEGAAVPVDEAPKVAAPALLPAEAPADVSAKARAKAPAERAEPTPSRRAPDAAAENAAPATRSAAKATAEPREASPAAQSPAQSSFAQKARAARRSLAMPSPDVLKLGGLVVVAGISLTLVFVALSR